MVASHPVPHLGTLHPLDLLLELQDAVHERLGRGRAAGHVDVDGDDAVAAAHRRVGVVVVAAAVGAAAHGDHPAGLGHLVVHFAEGGGHLFKVEVLRVNGWMEREWGEFKNLSVVKKLIYFGYSNNNLIEWSFER